MSVESISPEAAYLTKNNIVHTGTAAEVAAAEAKARADLQALYGKNAPAVVSGGTIKRG